MLIKLVKLVLVLTLALVVACTPLAFNADFTQDPAQRRDFVESTVIGQTTFDDLVARWGNPTSGNTAESGPDADFVWSWSAGLFDEGTWAHARVDHLGVVEAVWTGYIVNRQPVTDDFTAPPAVSQTPPAPVPAAAKQASTAVRSDARTPDADEGGGLFGIELECLIFCI